MDAIDEVGLMKLQREHAAALRALWARNVDLPTRLRAASVTAVYDADNDLFEIKLDGPREAVSYSIHNTLYLRADFETLKIVGIELDHFRQHVAENSAEFRFCLNVLLLAGGAKLTVWANADEPQNARLESIMRELATAN